MVLNQFIEDIFNQHFQIDLYEGFWKVNFPILKEQVKKDIKDTLIRNFSHLYDTYDEYMKDDETFDINLSDELMPFVSFEIRDLFHREVDRHNSNGDSDKYHYHIPDEVMKELITSAS